MVIVDWEEFGSGGNGVVFEASEVVFAASITVGLLVIVNFFFVLVGLFSMFCMSRTCVAILG